MGFGQDTHQLKTYVNIFAGNLAVQAKEGEEGAISRTNKNNKTVWEKHYPDLTGILESVEVRKNEHLKAWEYVIHLSDVGMHYYISIPCESRYGDNFAKKSPHLKFGKEITIKPYDFLDKTDGKKRIGVGLLQEGFPDKKIPVYYTKENPNGMPILTEKVDEEAYKIYTIQLNKFLREEVAKLMPLKTDSPPTGNNKINENVVNNTDDGLPF